MKKRFKLIFAAIAAAIMLASVFALASCSNEKRAESLMSGAVLVENGIYNAEAHNAERA